MREKKIFIVEIEFCNTSVENKHFDLDKSIIRSTIGNMLMGCKSVHAIQDVYSVIVTEIDESIE